MDQLRKLHIDPARVPPVEMFDIFDVDIDAIIRHTVELHRGLTSEVEEHDPVRSRTVKEHRFAQSRAATSELLQIADGVVAARLKLGGKPGQRLGEAYENLRLAVKAAHLATAANPIRRC